MMTPSRADGVRPLVITITGPSGAGKSTFASTLAETLQPFHPGGVAVIAEDAYYRDQTHLTFAQRQETNYDHPDAFDHALLIEHLSALRRGESAYIPIYDYVLHTRSARTFLQAPAEVLIVEGILVFSHAELLQLSDLRVLIDTPLDTCLSRRVARDTVERGRTASEVVTQFHRGVVPLVGQYRAQWLQLAQLVIDDHTPHSTGVQQVLRILQADSLP